MSLYFYVWFLLSDASLIYVNISPTQQAEYEGKYYFVHKSMNFQEHFESWPGKIHPDVELPWEPDSPIHLQKLTSK